MSVADKATLLELATQLDQWRNKTLRFSSSDGWETMVETPFLKMFRRPKNGTGPLNEYLTIGEFDTVPVETLKQVYLDFEYRKKWDPNTEHWRILEEAEESTLMYSSVYYPFPMSKRDYVFARKIFHSSPGSTEFFPGNEKSSEDVIAVIQSAVQNKAHPPNSGYVRVQEFNQVLVMKTNGANGALCATSYYEDPGGTIPKAILNWAANYGLPSFFSKMRHASENYATWKAS